MSTETVLIRTVSVLVGSIFFINTAAYATAVNDSASKQPATAMKATVIHSGSDVKTAGNTQGTNTLVLSGNLLHELSAEDVNRKINNLMRIGGPTFLSTQEKDAHPMFVSESAKWALKKYAKAKITIGTPAGTVDELILRLGNKDQNVRDNAAKHLIDCSISMGIMSVQPPLISALSNENWLIRLYVAFLLGKIGNKEAVTALEKVSEKDKSKHVRKFAKEAIDQIVKHRPSNLIERLKVQQVSKYNDIPALIKSLTDPSLRVHKQAAWSLFKIGKPAVPALIKALSENENWTTRRYVAIILGKIGPVAKTVIPALIKALVEDNNPNVRDATVYALAGIGKPAVPALIKAFDQHRTAYHAIEALSKIGKPAISALIKALEDSKIYVRANAALALGKMGPLAKTAVPALIKTLEDDNPFVRKKATWALAEIGPATSRAIPKLIRALESHDFYERKDAMIALSKIGKPAIPALIKALEDSNSNVRLHASGALGKMGPLAKSAVPALIERLKNDSKAIVRGNIAHDLGRIGPVTSEVIPALIKALGDKNSDVRNYAAKALAKIGTPAIPALIRALKNNNPDVRAKAAYALSAIGPAAKAAVPALIKSLEDIDSYVRFLSALALGKIGSAAKAAVPALIKASDDIDKLVREYAAEALEEIQQDIDTQ